MFVRIEHDLGAQESAGDVVRSHIAGERQTVDLGALDRMQRLVSELFQRDQHGERRVVGDREVERGFEDHDGVNVSRDVELTFSPSVAGFDSTEREWALMADVVSYRLLSTCPLDDAVRAWNDGFTGYFADLTLTADAFERRMRQDGIAAETSIVAFAGERPGGIAMSAIGEVHGLRQAWNGGTAVAEDYRGTGVARELLRRSIALYAEHQVRLATLEALVQNSRAIPLYAKFGDRPTGALT